MALTFVQAASIIGAATSSLGKAFTTNTTGSSYLLAWVLTNPTNSNVSSITDTLGNTWVPVAAQTPENIFVYECRINNASGGANTVTANFDFPASFCELIIVEYTGQITSGSPVDVCTTFQDVTGSSFTGMPATTSFTNETVVGIGFWNGTGTLTPTGGFTARFSDAAAFSYVLDVAKAAAGTYSPTISSNNAGTRFIQNTVTLKSTTSNGAQATPTFSPVAGAYGPTQNVTITSAGADNIYYTTDGSTPTTGSSIYSTPVVVASSLTLKALAVKANWVNSAIGSATYTINGTQATPTFSPVAGSYPVTQSVTITSAGADTIYYTNDGVTPTTGSTVYTGPVSVPRAMTLKALAIRAGFSNSAVGSAAYTISGGKGVNSSSPTTAEVVGGVYNAILPTLLDGQAAALQLDATGALITTGGGSGGGNVNITGVNGSAPALANPLPVELSDGTNSVGTALNPLSVNVISGGGSNASVGTTGATAPTSATEVGIIVAGNLVGVSSSNPVPVSAASLPLPTGAATAAKQDTGNTSLANLDVALSTRTKPADQQHAIVDSSALPTGAATSALQTTGNTSLANLDVALSTRTKPADQQHTIIDSGTTVVTQGTASNLHVAATLDAETTKVIGTVRNLGNAGAIFDGATAASVPANALYDGVRGSTALPTAVTDGQLAGGMADKYGRQVVVLNTVRDLVGRKTTQIVNSTAETTIATQVASTFLDITSLQITNASATVVSVTIKDSTAGTTVAIYDIAANGGISVQFPTPLTQTTVNNNWTATLSVNTVTVNISVQFVKNA